MIRMDKKVKITNKLNVLSARNKIVIAKGDSGAKNHYWGEDDMNCLKNIW